MRILVLGVDGMLGHQLAASMRVRHEVAGTVRLPLLSYREYSRSLPERVFDEVDAKDFASVARTMADFEPDAVVNAIGIVKQRDAAKDAIESIEVNSLFPHKLAMACAEAGIRMIHMSTDCLFSGRTGSYGDDALPDAIDLYGRSKMMGEVSGVGIMTLRTSIIGLELTRKKSLIEWFLAQSGTIRGFRKAIYSGFTTLEMSRIIERLLALPSTISGIYNVSSEPIDKFSLLCGLRDRLGKQIEIVPDDDFHCDRSLNSDRFRAEFDYAPPGWPQMLDELAAQIRFAE
jgi:dTDP-4-dehydrorhamnose reductase